jgi:hypothetical protein
MSSINASGLNTNYPVPGVNNSSQGFRDNFTIIKTNFDTAANEITQLQNSVVLKNSISGANVDNNMGNTLMSNVLTKGFRATTYNLGTNLSGTVPIDVSLGDVQIGTVIANTVLQFTNWAPSGTQSNVQLVFNFANNNAFITFPNTVLVTSNNSGATTLENFSSVSGNLAIRVPNGVSQLDYRLSTNDCGSTVIIEPFNRPRKTTQIQLRTPVNSGAVGDKAGTVCVDSNYLYVCTGDYDGITAIWKRIPLTAY